MADPFASLAVYCHYSSSQEDLFENSLVMREEISPESSSPPSPSAAIFAANGIIICSAPETPASETAAHPSTDEFKTPPEEPRRSSSEEAPPPPKTFSPPHPQPESLSPSHGGVFHGSESDGGQGTSAVETLDSGTQDLGFSQEEGNRSPRMVEILADGRVRVGEVSSSVRVGEKRDRSFEEPSPSPLPSKRIRVSVDSSVLGNTPDLECPVEIGANCEADQMIDTDVIESEDMIGTDVIESCEDGNEACANNGRVSVDSSVLVDTPDLECPVEIDTDVIETDQMVDTDVIELCEDGKEECGNNGGVSNVEQEHEEEEDKEEEEEEDGIENGDGGDEIVVDGAEDISSKQGRRSLPQSWTLRNGGNREAENRSNTERGSSGKGPDVVLEVLRWLAKEQREKQRDHGGSGDFLETAIRRGLTFP